MEQVGSQWTDFYEILYLSIFRKSAQNFQVLLISDKNNGYFTWRPMYSYVQLWKYLAEFFAKWENFRRKFVEKIKTYIL